jgi:ATP-dependent Clp protease ATP-binding subunit ClpA
MDDSMAYNVVEKKLDELAKMLTKKNISLEVDEKAKTFIKEKGVSQEFGAREIDRVIRNEVKPLFVDEILFGRFREGGEAILTVTDNKLEII